MDGTLAIEHNREALKRILASLVAMAGLGSLTSPLAAEDGSARRGKAEALAEPGEGCCSPAFTLPRRLHSAVLRLLRPAESAARRLIIAAAHGLAVTLPPPRKAKPKPVPVEPILRSLGIAVVMSPADFARAAAQRQAAARRAARPRVPSLPLFDPLRRPFRRRRNYVPAHAAPRILSFDGAPPHRLPPPPSRDGPVDATRLARRLAALAAALDDLPGQAMRFARWQARRSNLLAARRQASATEGARFEGTGNRVFRRISPLRPGRPPGGRLTRYDPSAVRRGNVREVDEILAHAHALALYALERPDTS